MTQAELQRLFAYEPDTGLLRRVSGGRVSYPWRNIGADGRYQATTVNGVTIYLHRAVFLYHHGYLPEVVDHKDRNTRNCRIENLREATHAENQYNSRRKLNNQSGAKGVVFHPKCRTKPWQAKIVVNKKVVSLGYYPTVALAAEAYAKGAAQYAGEFAFGG